MKKSIAVLSCLVVCLAAQEALAAVKYKRFPHCADGVVTVKTCECHAGKSAPYRYCHAGQYCHTFDGSCRN